MTQRIASGSLDLGTSPTAGQVQASTACRSSGICSAPVGREAGRRTGRVELPPVPTSDDLLATIAGIDADIDAQVAQGRVPALVASRVHRITRDGRATRARGSTGSARAAAERTR